MKAVDFIRKHGWTAVISVVNSTTSEETSAFETKDVEFLDKQNPMLGVSITVHTIPYLDVRKYADAYKLVQSYGGLDALELHLHSLPVNYESVKHLYEALSLVEEVGILGEYDE